MNSFIDPPHIDYKILEAVKKQTSYNGKVDSLINRVKTLREEELANARSAWMEDLEESNLRKQIRLNTASVAEEIVQANKAVLMVRRAALYYMLKKEHNKYVDELKAMGKTLYIKH